MAKPKTRRGNHEGSIVKRADGRFQASIMYDGKRKYYYNTRRPECVKWLTDMRTRIRRGMPVSDSAMTLGEWTEHYIATYCVGFVRSSTLQNYISYFHRHIKPNKVSAIKLSALSSDHIQVFMNDLKRFDGAGELSAHTQRIIWLFLNGALNAAENSGLIFRNPAKGVKLKKSDKKERPYLTDDAVRRLILAAEGHPWQIGIIILAHGLRISEMLALRHSSIKEVDGVLCFDVKHAVKRELCQEGGHGNNKTILRLSDPKTRTSVRLVPIMPAAIDIVKKHIEYQKQQSNSAFGCYEADPFLVGSAALGKMISPDLFRKWFRQCVDAAGLSKDVTPHALRHYAARTMVRMGSPAAAARVLGHSSAQTTLNHYVTENLSEAAKAINEIVLFK